MAINLKFDLTGNPEPPTIILANRNGNKLGQLKVNEDSIDLSDKFNDASELSFIVNKYIDGELTPLWDKLVDFKLVYCKEWNMWFEIKVELDEETESVKTVFCTQLGQAELSQIMLYNIEINTEDDIARDDYKISILWDENDPKSSILNRLLEKAPHYSIIHVDDTIKNIQRSFSFDGTSVHDAFQEIAEEIGCLFVYHSNSGENGKIQRTISVYDLQQNCLNSDCKHRGEFTDKCPKCDGTNIKQGYGEDTLIFVTSDQLASQGIQLVTDTDSVKNCFKLEGGDDLMTATIRNCNPNGTNYIWYFSDSAKEDMSDELVDKLNSYDNLYKDYYNNYTINLSVENYNSLVDKYSVYNKDLQKITSPIKGYSNLMNAYYNTIDLALYLKSGLMPSVEMSDTTAREQADLLTATFPSSVAVNTDNVESISMETAKSAVLSMAKIIVKPTYRVEIRFTIWKNNVWKGSFLVTNYSNEGEDFATSGTISVTVNNDSETFIKQKIEKALNKENTDDLSISGLFEKDYDDFCDELKKYALNPLKSFYDACDVCLNILIDQGAGNRNEKPDLYESLYEPYYKKSSAIASEIKVREEEIAIIEGVYDKTDANNPLLITHGLQSIIEFYRNSIQDALDFEKYLGEELWLEFCTYRREDTYSNENYISDGLDNAELFKRALEFYEVAENEIYKSSELQHSISTSLNNLLSIEKFKPLVDSFKVGNWIRVQVDDQIFKLRLLEYEIDFGSFENISVEFSDVTKIKNSIIDIESVLSQASSMATSYDSVQRQAKQGNNAQGTIDEWISTGLNSALVQIQNNDSEDVIFGKNGLLCRSYDEITDTYSPEQFRLTHNIMAYTTDNWETVSSALGKHSYKRWNGAGFIDGVDYGLTSKFVTAGYISGSQIIGGEIVSSNYKTGESGTYFNLVDGDFDIAGGSIVYDANDKALTLKNVTIEWSNTNSPEVTVNDITGLEEYLDQLDDLENQLDGRAETWYQDTDPSVNWDTDELKKLHIGDLWHYTGKTGEVNKVQRTKNSEWIWQEVNGSYQWVAIDISDSVFDAIDGKAQIFTSTPVPPYYVGDLWVQGSAGDIMNCIKERTSGSYVASDWAKSSKYTDDTTAKDALEKAKQGIADAAQGISLANAAQATANEAKTDATNAKTDAIAYANSQDRSLYDNLTTAYQDYANSKVSELDTAVGNYLGLGGSTLIGGSYVISPYIAGGYLNITSASNNSKVIIDPNNLTGNGYIFQVHNGKMVSIGIDKDGNASFAGNVTATSLTLGTGVSVPSSKVSGLSTVATSGKYSDLTGAPTIPKSVEDLGFDTSNIVYKGDITQSTKTDKNGISYVETSVPSSNGTITYSTYNADDYIVFGRSKGTNSSGNNYVCVSKDGLLTARNALIYGTIYATDGEFYGTIYNGDKNSHYTEIKDGIIKTSGLSFRNIDGNTLFFGGLATSSNNSATDDDYEFTMLADTGTIKELYDVYLNDGVSIKNFIAEADKFRLTGNVIAPNFYGVYNESTSDRNTKNTIETFDNSYDVFFDELQPCHFKYNDDSLGNIHFGFIAQDVEDSMIKNNIPSSACLTKFKEQVNGGYYTISKPEFIALNTWQIQKLKARVAELEEKISKLV